jgi:YqaJ-like viral recombinase domain
MIIHDMPQGSPAWHRFRAGIPTASEFDQILTPKTQKLAEARHKYACRIIAGRLMDWQAASLDNISHIRDGKENEPFAIQQLELANDITTQAVGIITTNCGRFGASPDRVVMVGDTVGITIEAKCPTVPKQFEYLLLGHDEAYRTQCQGQLHVAEADKAIFYSYHPGMPAYMVETGRDEPFIKKLNDALEQFSDELEALMERAKALGFFQASMMTEAA